MNTNRTDQSMTNQSNRSQLGSTDGSPFWPNARARAQQQPTNSLTPARDSFPLPSSIHPCRPVDANLPARSRKGHMHMADKRSPSDPHMALQKNFRPGHCLSS
jgi:hypothetical protein